MASDPGKYIHADPRLGPMLQMLRASGRKVFLATNSLWDYTNVVMNFLLLGTTTALKRNLRFWSLAPEICAISAHCGRVKPA